jgi:hypothetical protein
VDTPLVTMVVLDGFPDRHVHATRTSTLWSLAESGTRTVGWAAMTSATYPNHATFVTGADPCDHGLVANDVFDGDDVPMPSWRIGPGLPTLFDRLAGRHTEAVLGDHHLVPVMGARHASAHWPPGGRRPAGAALDPYGYVDDAVTIELLVEAAARCPELLIAQLNGPDTFGHLHGPDSPPAIESHRRVDAHLARVVSALDWSRSVLVVVSDHDQEGGWIEEPIDIAANAVACGVEVSVINEGTAAIVRGWPSSGPDLERIEGVVATAPIAGTTDMLVWCEPGHWFGTSTDERTIGVHGGPRTRAQVAIVAGGHPAAAQLGAAVAGRRVHAREWAPLILALLH